MEVGYSNDEEIDLIIDYKQRRELIEIKSSETFNPRMTKTLEKFIDGKSTGYLLYRGKAIKNTPDIHIMNYGDYLSVLLRVILKPR